MKVNVRGKLFKRPFWNSGSAPQLLTALLLSAAAISCPIAHTETPDVRYFDSENDSDFDGEIESGTDRSEAEIEDGGVDAGIEALLDEIRTGRPVEFDSEPLAGFFKALGDIDNGQKRLVRILHFGDSHTAADILTTAIRRPLQKRFGDGGRGFLLMGRPWRSYIPQDVETYSNGDWKMEKVYAGADPVTINGLYGLGGVATEAFEPGVYAVFKTSCATPFGCTASTFEVFYLKQPASGSFSVYVDDKLSATIDTASDRIESGFYKVEVKRGKHSFRVRLKGDGRVRLFGAVLETDGPGVVYDTLGVNGAFFYTPLSWNSGLMAEQVGRREPDLIATMYGANETDSRSINPEIYADEVRKTLERLRAGAPNASCLLLGPMDRKAPFLGQSGEDEQARLDWIIDVQRTVADEIGCAFFDTRSAMGGAGSHNRWRALGLAQTDGIHLTPRGYQILGDLLAQYIQEAYEKYAENTAAPKMSAQMNKSPRASRPGGPEPRRSK